MPNKKAPKGFFDISVTPERVTVCQQGQVIVIF